MDRHEPETPVFRMPLFGAVYASAIFVAAIFILNTGLGRTLERELDAPARTLVAAPVITLAVVVFCASMAALLVPDYRRQSMRVAEIAGWIIPAWLIMSATVLVGIAWALARID